MEEVENLNIVNIKQIGEATVGDYCNLIAKKHLVTAFLCLSACFVVLIYFGSFLK